MTEIQELIKSLEGLSVEFDKFREEQYNRFLPGRNTLLELVSKRLKETLTDTDIDISDAEQAYYDLTACQWRMGHMEYGNRIEDNIRFILKHVFGDEGVKHAKTVADVIIKKGERKLAIEVKSFIDTTAKSRQGLKKLSEKKVEAETIKGYEKYIVFAHNSCDEEISKKCLDQDRQWIILLSSCEDFTQASEPIWKKHTGYYPLRKLISVVNYFLNEKGAIV